LNEAVEIENENLDTIDKDISFYKMFIAVLISMVIYTVFVNGKFLD